MSEIKMSSKKRILKNRLSSLSDNMKQTSIVDSIKNMKSKLGTKKLKMYMEAIIVEDSEDEFVKETSKPVRKKLSLRKRKLPVPFSSDEEADVTAESENSKPKNYKSASEKGKTPKGSTDTLEKVKVTPKVVIKENVSVMSLNKPKGNQKKQLNEEQEFLKEFQSSLPNAESTPIQPAKESHISSLNSSTDSDKTIIPSFSPVKRTHDGTVKIAVSKNLFGTRKEDSIHNSQEPCCSKAINEKSLSNIDNLDKTVKLYESPNKAKISSPETTPNKTNSPNSTDTLEKLKVTPKVVIKQNISVMSLKKPKQNPEKQLNPEQEFLKEFQSSLPNAASTPIQPVQESHNSSLNSSTDSNKTIIPSFSHVKRTHDGTVKIAVSKNLFGTKKENSIHNSQEPCCSKAINENSLSNTDNLDKTVKLYKSPNKTKISSPETTPNKTNSTSKINSPKKENSKMNTRSLNLFKDIIKSVYSTIHLKNLLNEEKPILHQFLKMSTQHQFFCFKLFTRKIKWQNVFKFANIIGSDMTSDEIFAMYTFLLENKFVEVNYINEDVVNLLNTLDRGEVKEIYDSFRLKKATNKTQMVESLIKNCKKQSTLSFLKSTEDLLKERIQKSMGYCVKLTENVINAFNYVYLLHTFANSQFEKISDYFLFMLGKKVEFPQYTVENFTIFYSRNEFIRFAKARQCRDAAIKAIEEKDIIQQKQIGDLAFKELKILVDEGSIDPNWHNDCPHLKYFTPESVYAGVLEKSGKALTTKHPKDVRDWYEYLIENIQKKNKLGDWYNHLAWIYMRYLKPNNQKAADLIVEVLEQKSEYLSDIQLQDIAHHGALLLVSKKDKISQLSHDKIVSLLPQIPKNFPSIYIDAHCVRSNVIGLKRNYYITDKEGNKKVMSVEEVAKYHYIRECDFENGIHCEGSLICSTFTLFFWDILYETYIPGTFVSHLQSAPLDMFSNEFFIKRKDAIDKRLKEIEEQWALEDLIDYLKKNWNNYSHITALASMESLNEEMIEIVVLCVGRNVLTDIYKRLVQNYRYYRSGLPDLFMWNTRTRKSKFVEVKGENDKLSTKQKLWLKYLQGVKADVEVCQVHSIGSKKKSLKKNE